MRICTQDILTLLQEFNVKVYLVELKQCQNTKTNPGQCRGFILLPFIGKLLFCLPVKDHPSLTKQIIEMETASS